MSDLKVSLIKDSAELKKQIKAILIFVATASTNAKEVKIFIK